MDADIFGAAVAFAIGAVIAWANYRLSGFALKKHPAQYSLTMVVRQAVQVAYVVLLFCLGKYTPWDRLWLLVGGVLGVTLPMFWFTFRLVKLNDSLGEKEGDGNG